MEQGLSSDEGPIVREQQRVVAFGQHDARIECQQAGEGQFCSGKIGQG